MRGTSTISRVPPLRFEAIEASPNVDVATAQTVERMCAYVRQSAADPLVQRIAALARRTFAQGSLDPAANAWAAFWMVKHLVKFRLDEGTMFQIGKAGEQDLLIAPAVLFRMKVPKEDCDGFTMAVAVLCYCLGVPGAIVTVAAELEDPRRWSHVFFVATLPGGRVWPLDASHGWGPGWMVPRNRINRWQAWNLDGRPVDVRPSEYQGLHGYVSKRRRGMGDTCYDETGLAYDCPTSNVGYGGGSSGGSSINWGNILSSVLNNAASLTNKALTPPAYQQVLRDPVTGQVYSTTTQYAGGSPGLFSGGSLASSPLLFVGLGFLAILALKGSK